MKNMNQHLISLRYLFHKTADKHSPLLPFHKSIKLEASKIFLDTWWFDQNLLNGSLVSLPFPVLYIQHNNKKIKLLLFQLVII